MSNIKILLILIAINIICIQSTKDITNKDNKLNSINDGKFLDLINFKLGAQVNFGNSTLLSYASCYWVNNFNLFDITPLKTETDK